MQNALRGFLPSLEITLPGEYGVEEIDPPLDFGPLRLEGESLLLYHMMDHPDLFAFACAAAGVSGAMELFQIESPLIKKLHHGEHLGIRHREVLVQAGLQYTKDIEALLQKEGIVLGDFTETLRRLRFPFYPEESTSGGFPSGHLQADQNKREIQRVMRQEASQGRRLHVLLGGTL